MRDVDVTVAVEVTEREALPPAQTGDAVDVRFGQSAISGSAKHRETVTPVRRHDVVKTVSVHVGQLQVARAVAMSPRLS